MTSHLIHLRAPAVGSAAVALVLLSAAPALAVGDETAATNYPPAEYCAISANPSNLVAGGTTTVTVTDKPNAETKLTVTSTTAGIDSGAITIAGAQTAVKTTDGDGKATFAVTLSAAGNYTLDASMGTGRVCALNVVVTGVTEDEGDEDEVLGVEDAETLALTGADAPLYLTAAVALAAAGAGAILLARRRSHS